MSHTEGGAAKARVWIKICGLTTPADVASAIEAGVDGVGIVLEAGYASSVSTQQASEMLEVLSGSGVLSVAVVGSVGADGVAKAASLGFDVVQWVTSPQASAMGRQTAILPVLFDGDDVEEEFVRWKPRMAELARSADWPSAWPTEGLINIDSAAGGGSGTAANWARVARLGELAPVMLAGGLRVNNVAAAIEQVSPFAIDVSSGVERSPGRKDGLKMRDFVTAAQGG